jgi:hypothetical protein
LPQARASPINGVLVDTSVWIDHFRNRNEALENLLDQDVSLHEAMEFIERASMQGIGCGLVDMILLTSTLITPGAKLWRSDQRLARLAERFCVAPRVAVH